MVIKNKGNDTLFKKQAWVRAVAFSPDGKIFMAATQQWVHFTSVIGDTVMPKASRLLSGTWSRAFHFLDDAAKQIQVVVHFTGNSIKLDTLRFDIPDTQPIQGDPKALLKEWQRKLALKIDDDGKIVSMLPVELSKRPER